MQVNQKELLLLPYPFSDHKGVKVRPALVVSNDSFNRKGKDCLVVPLTTVIKDEPYSVIINQSDLCAGKLLKSSRVRADKIFNIEKSLIIMKIGIVSDKVLNNIIAEIEKMF